MNEPRGLKPLIIYRIPNRNNLFRAYGLFCLGHSFVWAGITWACLTGRSDMKILHFKLGERTKSDKQDATDQQISQALEKPEWVQSVESKVPKIFSSLESQIQSIRASNAESASKFVDFFRPKLDFLSGAVKENRIILMSSLSALLAFVSLLSGYLLPRRAVHQLSLLPLGSSIGSTPNRTVASRMQQLVEIRTYDAFGFRSPGIQIIVPLSSIRTKIHQQKKQLLTFNVNNYFLPFVLQTEGAEFPEPDEFEYTFISANK